MDESVIINRFMTEFPEFCWDHRQAGIYCGASFCTDSYPDTICMCLPWTTIEQLKKAATTYNHVVLSNILNQVEEYEEVEIPCKDIDEKMLDVLVAGVKDWKSDMDKLRHGEDKQQLIVLHPDVDEYSARDILASVTVLAKDDDGYRLALVNAKDYDFRNQTLCDTILDNSRDCFAIWRLEESSSSRYYELYDQAKELYPMIDNISDIFDTDYD